jgi:hypothetical protein
LRRPQQLKGPEWNRLHAAAVDYLPDILDYQTHTTRLFPLIVLDPVPDIVCCSEGRASVRPGRGATGRSNEKCGSGNGRNTLK